MLLKPALIEDAGEPEKKKKNKKKKLIKNKEENNDKQIPIEQLGVHIFYL